MLKPLNKDKKAFRGTWLTAEDKVQRQSVLES
jgi:hypothetical protein